MALINNKKYSWSDIHAVVLNRLILGITAINYSSKREYELAMGQGDVAQGYTKGSYKPTAKVKLQMDEMQALRRIAPGGDITNLPPVTWTITYVDDDNIPVTHEFTATFTNDEGGGDNGSNKALESDIELFVIGKINYNA